jgi:hypothetical protein
VSEDRGDRAWNVAWVLFLVAAFFVMQATGCHGTPTKPPAWSVPASRYGEPSAVNGRPKTIYVPSYVRRDGTRVRAHWRSTPTRRGDR